MKTLASLTALLLTSLVLSAQQEGSSRHLQQIERQTAYESLRIHVEYLTTDLESEKRNLLENQVVKAAAAYFENALSTKRIDGMLVLSGISTCIEAEVPVSHSETGVEADVIIYVTYSDSPSSSLGWGAYCAYDVSNDQPVAGNIHIYTSNLSSETVEQYIAGAAQQIAHVLAFNSYLFEKWEKSAGVKYQNDQTVSELFLTATRRGKSKRLLITPKVVQQARTVFACETLDGVELEESGGEGIANTLWDSYIMYNDFLAADIKANNIVYSTISLAAFEDSGWYTADYSYGSDMVWWKDAQCNFLTTNCVVNGAAQDNKFCTTLESANVSSCDYNYLTKGYCNLIQYTSNLPTQYQYFADAKRGGSDSFVDYCPVVKTMDNGNCRDSNNTGNVNYGEAFGDSSRCITGNYVKQAAEGETQEASVQHSGCHKVECQSDKAIITIGDQTVECPFTGGTATIDGYLGSVTCPNSNILCQSAPCPNNCYGVGTCSNGVCNCNDGTTGTDCLSVLNNQGTEDDDFSGHMILGAMVLAMF